MRRGPFREWPEGKYRGIPVIEVIENDPMAFMQAVKGWLDITEHQADVFREITGGGEIPTRYIKRVLGEDELKRRDDNLYNTNRDILPNWDFDPSVAPRWWPEFKERCKTLTHCSQRVDLYNSYVRQDMQESLRQWQSETSGTYRPR